MSAEHMNMDDQVAKVLEERMKLLAMTQDGVVSGACWPSFTTQGGDR
jgi:hypothetical protein